MLLFFVTVLSFWICCLQHGLKKFVTGGGDKNRGKRKKIKKKQTFVCMNSKVKSGDVSEIPTGRHESESRNE